jgi:hypothetical protein
MCVQETKTANRFEISSLLENILLKQVRWCLTLSNRIYMKLRGVGSETSVTDSVQTNKNDKQTPKIQHNNIKKDVKI